MTEWLGPTANEVAKVIVAAARETGADPISVARGASKMGRAREEWFTISRARAYAGVAIEQRFPELSRPKIAALIGVGPGASRESYFPALEQRRSHGILKWWNPDALARIVAALGAEEGIRITRTPQPPEEGIATTMPSQRPTVKLSANPGGYASASSPQSNPGKRALQTMLAEAVRNTAKIQTKEKDR